MSKCKVDSIFEEDMEKVYLVDFLNYTNCSYDTVRHNKEDMVFLDAKRGQFLVRESELDYYMRNWGGGVETIKYVGMITKDSHVREEKK